MHVYSSNITSPTDTGFGLTLNGQVKKTGIFPAKISFPNPVDVYWINPDNNEELHLGHFPLSYIGAAAGHARINQETFFTIDDLAGFSRFSQYLITQEEFTWRLRTHEVTAKAFSFLAAPGLTFTKDLTINGALSVALELGLTRANRLCQLHKRQDHQLPAAG